MSVIKIVGATIDSKNLVLFDEHGKKTEISQGHPALKRIVDEITDPLTRNGFVNIDIDLILETSIPDIEKNDYSEFERHSAEANNEGVGGVKILRVAKRWLKKIFGHSNTTNVNDEVCGVQTYGTTVFDEPKVESEESSQGTTEPLTNDDKPALRTAIDEIISNATPVSAPSYRSEQTLPDETLIAAVTDKETGEVSIVPGVERLRPQFAHAGKLGNTKGVETFLGRIAKVIHNRGHSVDELLNFMHRGDLPIADDGSIIGYKILRRKPDQEGYYVDCHTYKVPQRIGSQVTQLNVDTSRRTECSVGLHIARRKYLENFSGDIVTIVKINPEDVLAVPHNEPDKMRAGAYHILFELPNEDYQALRRNQVIQTKEGKQMLERALRGRHTSIIETVVIGGAKGNDVVVTSVAGSTEPTEDPVEQISKIVEIEEVEEAEAESVEIDLPTNATERSGDIVDPNQVHKTAVAAKDEVKSEQRKLFEAGNYTAVQALKKAKKKSYEKLGFTAAEEDLIVGTKGTKTLPIVRPLAKNPTKSLTKPKITGKVTTVKAPAEPQEESRMQKARRLYEAGAWKELYAHKKAVKVSFSLLGFNQQEIDKIDVNKN